MAYTNAGVICVATISATAVLIRVCVSWAIAVPSVTPVYAVVFAMTPPHQGPVTTPRLTVTTPKISHPTSRCDAVLATNDALLLTYDVLLLTNDALLLTNDALLLTTDVLLLHQCAVAASTCCC